MRVLITGATGQLGRELARGWQGHDLAALSHADLDVADEQAVQRTVRSLRPDLVLNAAAFTDTRACEADPALAFRVNADAPGYLAAACAAIGCPLVHFSTNEVFDGAASTPYDEDAPPHPLNAYARSKLAGEERVRALLPRHFLVRTSWLYGEGERNFIQRVEGAPAGPLRMTVDEVASPTWARDLAAAVVELVARGQPGTYHLTNQGAASRLDWARELFRLLGRDDVHLVPITLAEYGGPWRKPPYTVLANRRAAALGITLPPWQDALQRYLAARGALPVEARR